MSSATENPQIGPFDVDIEVVAAEGQPLATLLESLGVELERGTEVADLPGTGWRVLQRRDSGETTLGAPIDGSALLWRIVHAVADGQGGLLSLGRVHPDELPLRPSRAERAKGLVLRWPPLSVEEAADGVFVIDIVNEGQTRWRPDGDPFLVVGALTRPDEPPATAGFGYFAGQHPAVPLDPGEYARVHVSVDDGQWSSLHPGIHEMHAILSVLPVRTAEPLSFMVTREQIERRAARRRSRVRPPGELARARRDSLAHQTALLRAAEQLEEIARLVVSADDDEDATAAVAEALGIDQNAARSIGNTPLTLFTAESVRQMRAHVAQLEKEIAQSAADE